jgi:hypothetical protein
MSTNNDISMNTSINIIYSELLKMYNKFNNSVGPLSISKQELIKFYNRL